MYSLLVANIPHDCSEDEFRLWLEEKGVTVNSLKLITDLVTGTSPSFAQIELPQTANAAVLALRLDGQSLKNSPLRVKALKLIDVVPSTRHMKSSAP